MQNVKRAPPRRRTTWRAVEDVQFDDDDPDESAKTGDYFVEAEILPETDNGYEQLCGETIYYWDPFFQPRMSASKRQRYEEGDDEDASSSEDDYEDNNNDDENGSDDQGAKGSSGTRDDVGVAKAISSEPHRKRRRVLPQ